MNEDRAVEEARPGGAGVRGGGAEPSIDPPEPPPSPASPLPTSASTSSDTSPSLLGTNLAPVLQDHCEQRLSEINWFRTDWQRGGAVTGYATYEDDAGVARDVVVKWPVPPGERYWLAALQEAEEEVAPVVYAHGETLGSYDLAWVVMERLPHGPLGLAWEGQEFDLLTEAIGRFYAAARSVPLGEAPPERDWEAICDQARKAAHKNGALPNAQRWNAALKKAQKKLDQWLRVWDERPRQDWCHGDLHLGNAMTRQPAPEGPALLFDFSHTRPGHWVEDGVYFEHVYWARPDRLEGRRLCRQIARQRKALGLAVDSDWARYAQIRRGLLAMSVPARAATDGDPRYLEAALDVLEKTVAQSV